MEDNFFEIKKAILGRFSWEELINKKIDANSDNCTWYEIEVASRY